MPTACSIPRKGRASNLGKQCPHQTHVTRHPAQTASKHCKRLIQNHPEPPTPECFTLPITTPDHQPNCATPRAPEVRSGSPHTPHSAPPAQLRQFTSTLPVPQNNPPTPARFNRLAGIPGSFHIPRTTCRYSQLHSSLSLHSFSSAQVAP